MTGTIRGWAKRFILMSGGLLLLGGLVLWWQWKPLVTWYHVHGLSRAPEEERERWVHSVAALQETVLPRLLRCLQQEDERACENVRVALIHIIQSWPPDDERRADFASRLSHAFPGCSTPGQRAVLSAARELLTPADPATPSAASVTRLLVQVGAQADSSVQATALDLAGTLLEHARGAEAVAAGRTVATQALSDPNPEVRLQAIRLAQTPGMDCLDKVVPLLDDAAPEVRRAAMLAVGTARDAIAEDDLLRWLHDSDPDTRQLCEQALRSRGLQDPHLKLGRLLTDRQPGTRLQVLEHLRRVEDLDPGVWLRRLSHDPAPAVRAAAVRAAAEQPLVDLSDRLEQMTQNDPSPTVRELARFYLRASKAAQD